MAASAELMLSVRSVPCFHSRVFGAPVTARQLLVPVRVSKHAVHIADNACPGTVWRSVQIQRTRILFAGLDYSLQGDNFTCVSRQPFGDGDALLTPIRSSLSEQKTNHDMRAATARAVPSKFISHRFPASRRVGSTTDGQTDGRTDVTQSLAR